MKGTKLTLCSPFLYRSEKKKRSQCNYRLFESFHLHHYKQNYLHTFWRAIRGGDDNDSVLEEILEELLKNHGVSDVGHLTREM